MTTTTAQGRPFKVKLLSDFATQGLIGRWFGGLQLVAVKKTKKSRPLISDVACRVICPNGHMSTRMWWQLRDDNRKRACNKCKAPKRAATNPCREELLKKINELSPERRRLFNALLESRRRVGDQHDNTFDDHVKDAYTYAIQIADPEQELKDLQPESGYETCGRSSLRSPNFMYVEAG